MYLKHVMKALWVFYPKGYLFVKLKRTQEMTNFKLVVIGVTTITVSEGL